MLNMQPLQKLYHTPTTSSRHAVQSMPSALQLMSGLSYMKFSMLCELLRWNMQLTNLGCAWGVVVIL